MHTQARSRTVKCAEVAIGKEGKLEKVGEKFDGWENDQRTWIYHTVIGSEACEAQKARHKVMEKDCEEIQKISDILSFFGDFVRHKTKTGAITK